MLIRILIKYSCRQPSYNIKESLDVVEKTVDKIVNSMVARIAIQGFRNNKLDGPGNIFQIDETSKKNVQIPSWKIAQ